MASNKCPSVATLAKEVGFNFHNKDLTCHLYWCSSSWDAGSKFLHRYSINYHLVADFTVYPDDVDAYGVVLVELQDQVADRLDRPVRRAFPKYVPTEPQETAPAHTPLGPQNDFNAESVIPVDFSTLTHASASILPPLPLLPPASEMQYTPAQHALYSEQTSAYSDELGCNSKPKPFGFIAEVALLGESNQGAIATADVLNAAWKLWQETRVPLIELVVAAKQLIVSFNIITGTEEYAHTSLTSHHSFSDTNFWVTTKLFEQPPRALLRRMGMGNMNGLASLVVNNASRCEYIATMLGIAPDTVRQIARSVLARKHSMKRTYDCTVDGAAFDDGIRPYKKKQKKQ